MDQKNVRNNIQNNPHIFIKLVMGIVLCITITTKHYSTTRTNNLPSGFSWRYSMKETEETPRSGKFWRSGIILEDKIIVLNTYYLIALDLSGKELWKRGLIAENPYSEASIHSTSSNEIIVIITDALLRINTDTGEMIDHYGYDVRKRSAFQFTELLPRHSIFYNNHIYVFLGPQLLSFHKESLERKIVGTFNSSPKTLPILYKDSFILSFNNGFVELFNPKTTHKETLIFGSHDIEYSIRQPIVQNDLIFIPSNKDIKVYSNSNLFAVSDQFTDNILDNIDNQIWLRQHNKGTIFQIDETLSSRKSILFVTDKYANKIGTPLAGNRNTLINIDGIEGQLFIIQQNPLTLKKTIYSEDFIDNPPLQNLDQTSQFLLLGAFNALYLIDINTL